MISCVVTTYKRKKEILKRAIDSIVGQTYKNIEIIVVNDAPEMEKLSEEIKGLIDSYKIPIKYVVHEKNMGACAARNTGIEMSTGEYIAFLDDDDEWLPNKLEVQLQKMEETGAALVYSAYYNIDAKDAQTVKRDIVRPCDIDKSPFERLLISNYIGSTSFPLLNAEEIKKVGGFNTILKSSQDYDLWLKISMNNTIAYCDEPLVRYYYSQEAISRNMDNKVQGYEHLLKEYENYYLANKELLNYKYNVLACDCLVCHSYKLFVEYWTRAVRTKILCKNNLLFLDKIINRIRKKDKMF